MLQMILASLDLQVTSGVSQKRSGFFLEVMVTGPSQVMFIQLELRHDTDHGGGPDRECSSQTGMQQRQQRQTSPLTVVRTQSYSPAMQTPAFRRQVAKFTSSAIVPGTGQVSFQRGPRKVIDMVTVTANFT